MRPSLPSLRASVTGADRVVVPLAALSAALVLVCLLLRGIGTEPYITLFSVTVESNVPTWYSAGLLLATGLVAAALGALAPRDARGLRIAWFAVAAILLLLSLDDTASLHERLGNIGADLVNGQAAGGLLHFTWVVPGFLAAAIVAAAMLQLARQLPVHVRRQLIFGTVLFFAGALGAEMASGVVLDAVGDGLGYALVTGVEELLEMLGVVVILRGFLQVVDIRRTGPASISVRYASRRIAQRRPAGWAARPHAGTDVPTHGEAEPPGAVADVARAATAAPSSVQPGPQARAS